MVRNFYLEASVDGRKTDVGTGPRAKDGGMNLTVYQRNKGAIETVVSVYCVEEGGQLMTGVFFKGQLIGTYRTGR